MAIANRGAFELGKESWGHHNLPHQDKEFMETFGECADLEDLKKSWKKGLEFQCLEKTGYAIEFMNEVHYSVGRAMPLEEATEEFINDKAGWVYCRKAGGFFHVPFAQHLITANKLLELFYEYDEDCLLFGDSYPYRGGEAFLNEEGNAIKSSFHKDTVYAIGFEDSMSDEELDILGYDYEIQKRHYLK